MSNPIKYGLNPHRKARLLGGNIEIVNGNEVSLNSFLDVVKGQRLLSSQNNCSVSLAYIKHVEPVWSCGGGDHIELTSRAKYCVSINREVTHGTFVVGGVLDDRMFDVVKELDLAFHTIAASSFSAPVIEAVSSGEFQALNKGVAMVKTDSRHRVTMMSIVLGGARIEFDDEDGSIDANLVRTVGRNMSDAIDDSELASLGSVLSSIRTTAYACLSEGDLLMSMGGALDSVTGLQQFVHTVTRRGIDLSKAVVATDGCFGIRDPVPTLHRSGVKRFVFCGGKDTDNDVLSACDSLGITCVNLNQRLFSLL